MFFSSSIVAITLFVMDKNYSPCVFSRQVQCKKKYAEQKLLRLPFNNKYRIWYNCGISRRSSFFAKNMYIGDILCQTLQEEDLWNRRKKCMGQLAFSVPCNSGIRYASLYKGCSYAYRKEFS